MCVHQNTLLTVKTWRGPIQVPISKIKKNDEVQTSDGSFAKVECVVETIVDQNHEYSLMMIQLGSLIITPYHPIQKKNSSTWIFPINHPDGKVVDCAEVKTPSIFNLVLEKNQRHKGVVMDGFNSITLGHGITDDEVLHHEYFGSEHIITDLSSFDRIGFRKGHIALKEKHIQREDEDEKQFETEDRDVEICKGNISKISQSCK